MTSTLLSWQFCVAQILVDVLGAISSTCLRNREKHPGRRCQAYLPDLSEPKPPDLPAAAGKRLRVINGRGVTGRVCNRRGASGGWGHLWQGREAYLAPPRVLASGCKALNTGHSPTAWLHARRALVGAALSIGMRQSVFAADLVVEGVEAVVGFCLRFRVQMQPKYRTIWCAWRPVMGLPWAAFSLAPQSQLIF